MDTKTASQPIWEIIQKSKRILLTLHPSPDPDSVGSNLALAHALRGLGKKVTVIGGDSPLPTFLAHLPDFNTIVPKTWSEIDPTQFDLFLILDISDLDRISRKVTVTFPSSLHTVAIDHHVTNKEFAEINLVESKYPATAQILYELFQEWGIKLTHDIALCLFVGLWGDTLSFKIPATLSSTFRVASELIAVAPDFAEAVFMIENNRTPEEIKFQALALNSLTIFPSGKVAYVAVNHEALSKQGIDATRLETGSLANFLKSVKGWEIGACFTELEPGLVKASFRTRDAKHFDLSRLATALGGGGHPAAAGVAFKYTLPEAVERFRIAVGELYPELIS